MFKENQKLSVGKVDMSRQWTEGGDSKRIKITEVNQSHCLLSL